MIGRRTVLFGMSAAAATAGLPVSFVLAAYPEKQITFIIPFDAGGGTDRWARLLGAESGKYFGEAWQVINVTGAQGVVGWKQMLDSPPDGYTLLIGSGTINLSLALNPTPAVEDSQIKIVSVISAFQSLLVTKPDQPWSTWDGFKQHVAENPNKLTVGGSIGNLVQLASITQQAGLQVRYVPYPGAGPATTDFLGGHIDAVGIVSTIADPIVPEEAVVVFNASNEPVEAEKFKDVPTAKDLGLEGMTIPRWIGVHPDTPDDIADQIAAGLRGLLEDPAVTEPLRATGEAAYFTPRAESQQIYDRMVEQMKEASKVLQ